MPTADMTPIAMHGCFVLGVDTPTEAGNKELLGLIYAHARDARVSAAPLMSIDFDLKRRRLVGVPASRRGRGR